MPRLDVVPLRRLSVFLAQDPTAQEWVESIAPSSATETSHRLGGEREAERGGKSLLSLPRPNFASH